MNKSKNLIVALILSLAVGSAFASEGKRFILPPTQDSIIGLLKSGGGGCTGQEGKVKSNRQGQSGGTAYPCGGITHPEIRPRGAPSIELVGKSPISAAQVEGLSRAYQILDQIELSPELRAQLKAALVPSSTHIYSYGSPAAATDLAVVVTSGDQYSETTLLPNYIGLSLDEQALTLIRSAAKLLASDLIL